MDTCFEIDLRVNAWRTTSYLLTVIRYIHKNPVKASIISKPEEYEWSSCTAYYKADRNTATFPDTSLILRIVHNEKKKAIEELQKFTENGPGCTKQTIELFKK